jgi:hypothetical protein
MDGGVRCEGQDFGDEAWRGGQRPPGRRIGRLSRGRAQDQAQSFPGARCERRGWRAGGGGGACRPCLPRPPVRQARARGRRRARGGRPRRAGRRQLRAPAARGRTRARPRGARPWRESPIKRCEHAAQHVAALRGGGRRMKVRAPADAPGPGVAGPGAAGGAGAPPSGWGALTRRLLQLGHGGLELVELLAPVGQLWRAQGAGGRGGEGGVSGRGRCQTEEIGGSCGAGTAPLPQLVRRTRRAPRAPSGRPG